MGFQSGRIALALWLAALLMAGCATPQDKQAQADRDALGSVLDTDKDGKITKEEFMAKTAETATLSTAGRDKINANIKLPPGGHTEI